MAHVTQLPSETPAASPHTHHLSEKSFLKDREFQADLQRLRQTDNTTNIYYIAVTWLKVALVMGASVWFFLWRAQAGLPWVCDVPVVLLAIVVMGALQHQLAALGHEASHFALFRNRKFNELMGDVFCFFPFFSSTQVYRLQHLDHHKWVNDPDRDPDMKQLHHSGHKFEFPKTKREVVALLLQQLLPLNQIRYSLGRIRHLAVQEKAARHTDEAHESRLVPLLFLGSIFSMLGMLITVSIWGDATQRVVFPAVLAAVTLTAILLLPERLYGPRIARTPVPLPIAGTFRLATIYVQFAIFFATGWWFGPRAAVYLSVLWAVPLLTTFSLFNMIRQVVHHANADSGWLSNSRNLFVGPLFRSAVFPFGQEMHLIHHLFSSVPHYSLRPLHERLMQFPEYRHEAVQVEGWLWNKGAEAHNPAVVDVLGPAYTPQQPTEQFIDYSVDVA